MRLLRFKMIQKKDGFLLGVFFFTALAVYFAALKNYFINDDLIHLDFVRNFKGNYLDFLLPHVKPSDVVTHARYEPFHIYFYAFLHHWFRDFFPAYQFLNIAAHAFNSFLIYKIAKRLGLYEAGAFIAALFFCVYRLNSQSVLWYASLFCTISISLLFLAFLFFLKQNRKSHFCSVFLFLAAVLLSLRASQYVFLVGVFLWIFRKELARQGLLALDFKTLLGYSGVAAFSIVCNLISWQYFPNTIPGFEFDFFGGFAFFINLVFPYEGNLLFKTAVFLIFCAIAVKFRKDKAVAFLAGAIAANAFFWFLIFSAAHLPYAPRYSYLGAGLFCLLLGHLLSRVLKEAPGIQRFFAKVLVAGFVGINVWAVMTQDIVWFEYLSLRGQKLEKLSRHSNVEKKKVFIKEDFFSNDPNLDYFKDRLEFVGPSSVLENKVAVIDLERDRYVKYFGRDFGREYWFQPWFIKKPCKQDTPWC